MEGQEQLNGMRKEVLFPRVGLHIQLDQSVSPSWAFEQSSGEVHYPTGVVRAQEGKKGGLFPGKWILSLNAQDQ